MTIRPFGSLSNTPQLNLTFVETAEHMSDLLGIVTFYLNLQDCGNLELTCRSFQHLCGNLPIYYQMFMRAGIPLPKQMSFKEAILKGAEEKNPQCLLELCRHYCLQIPAYTRASEIIQSLKKLKLSDEQQFTLTLRMCDLAIEPCFHAEKQIKKEYEDRLKKFVYSIVNARASSNEVVYYEKPTILKKNWKNLVLSNASDKTFEAIKTVATYYYLSHAKHISFYKKFNLKNWAKNLEDANYQARFNKIFFRGQRFNSYSCLEEYKKDLKSVLEIARDPFDRTGDWQNAILFVGFCISHRLTDEISDDEASVLLQKLLKNKGNAIILRGDYLNWHKDEAYTYLTMILLRNIHRFANTDIDAMHRCFTTSWRSGSTMHHYSPLFEALLFLKTKQMNDAAVAQTLHNLSTIERGNGDPSMCLTTFTEIEWESTGPLIHRAMMARLFLCEMYCDGRTSLIDEKQACEWLEQILQCEQLDRLSTRFFRTLFPKDYYLKAKFLLAFIWSENLQNYENKSETIYAYFSEVSTSRIAEERERNGAKMNLAAGVIEELMPQLTVKEAIQLVEELDRNPNISFEYKKREIYPLMEMLKEKLRSNKS